LGSEVQPLAVHATKEGSGGINLAKNVVSEVLEGAQIVINDQEGRFGAHDLRLLRFFNLKQLCRYRMC
jgi:hypothetical protein